MWQQQRPQRARCKSLAAIRAELRNSPPTLSFATDAHHHQQAITAQLLFYKPEQPREFICKYIDEVKVSGTPTLLTREVRGPALCAGHVNATNHRVHTVLAVLLKYIHHRQLARVVTSA